MNINSFNSFNSHNSTNKIKFRNFENIESACEKKIFQQKINYRVYRLKKLCIEFSNKKYLQYSDILKLFAETSIIKKIDPINFHSNANFIEVVYRLPNSGNNEVSETNQKNKITNKTNNQTINQTNKFEFIKLLNGNYDFEQIINQFVTTKNTNLSIRFWDGIEYKDGFSFQIFGTHNIESKVSNNKSIYASACYILATDDNQNTTIKKYVQIEEQ